MPYYIGDLKREPNVENYPFGFDPAGQKGHGTTGEPRIEMIEPRDLCKIKKIQEPRFRV